MEMTGKYQTGTFRWTRSPRPEGEEVVVINDNASYNDQRVLAPVDNPESSVLRCSVVDIEFAIANRHLIPIKCTRCMDTGEIEYASGGTRGITDPCRCRRTP